MTDRAWVADASPLIMFGKLDRLVFFDALAPKIIVPASVASEIAAGGEDAETRIVMRWIEHHIEPDIDVPASILGWDLGAGESQVLSYCLNYPQHRAVMDDGGNRSAPTSSFRRPTLHSEVGAERLRLGFVKYILPKRKVSELLLCSTSITGSLPHFFFPVSTFQRKNPENPSKSC